MEHPILDSEAFKEFLMSHEEIRLTRHFEEERLPLRPKVSRELIFKHVSEPEALVEFSFQEDDHRRPKYAVFFDKSTKYLLKLVISSDGQDIFIVTAHLVNKKRKDVMEDRR